MNAADIAIFPFIRQFANVDLSWWNTRPYPNVAKWLQQLLGSDLFKAVMKKYPQWRDHDEDIAFPP